MSKKLASAPTPQLTFEDFKTEVLQDYKIAFESRQASLLGRKEVLTGKAKFGIFGDGKEVAQLAMAKAFRNGDIRSGYYRDQTFMFATGMSNIREFFAQLYAHVNVKAEPASAGRLMNGHFATRMLDDAGNFKDLTSEPHSTSDISPTAGQMGRALGIAYASKLYRQNPDLKSFENFSKNGDEVSFVTIGNASTSEGHFWETINAAGVLQVPLAVNIWDDQYGISVPAKYQTTKENLSEILKGFETNEHGFGYRIYNCKGWDYPALCEMYMTAIEEVRETHMPVIFHITEITQPQGHSTSGSHERYKSEDRLKWEAEHDCLKKMREWMLANGIATSEQLDSLESTAIDFVKQEQKSAWDAFRKEIEEEKLTALNLLNQLSIEVGEPLKVEIERIANNLSSTKEAIRKDIMSSVRKVLRLVRGVKSDSLVALKNWKSKIDEANKDKYSSYLHSSSETRALNINAANAVYSENSPQMNGFEILNKVFDSLLEKEPRFFAIGEDVGKIGDVNQGFSGLQAKYGELRVSDTGIREMTIVGQGLGASMRGLKPLVEIQYLDYLLYALQIMSDDIATLQYRTKGGQKAPLIIRTRGHRLEGIWHSGSPIGMILHAVRGMHVLVPRNMVQAAGMYNLLIQSDEPALVIECLNGYRLKERLPDNYANFTVPLGKVEVLRSGVDLTLVTYGSCCRIALEAAEQLKEVDIDVENEAGRDLIHRPAYGSDGDYFSKPSVDDVFEKVYAIMQDAEPGLYPKYLD